MTSKSLSELYYKGIGTNPAILVDTSLNRRYRKMLENSLDQLYTCLEKNAKLFSILFL